MSTSSPSDRVLSTLNQDGSRFLIRPRLSPGRFLTRRRVVAWALIVLFVALPRLRIGGRPAFLIDLVTREISIAGAVFRPSDGFLLMLLGLTVVLTVFFVTALWGRVWCGWGCPQTVYLEHVFRPIERLWEGSPSEQRKLDATKLPSWRRVGKWVTFAALAFAVANVFLAYFVGTDRLEQWITHSPATHPVGFGVVVFVSGLMFFDFAYFREQTCIVACPYGRLQSVLVDKQSLIIGYDAGRGEPRGKSAKKTSLPVVTDGASPAAAPKGDCIDCGACVTTCPTGIDIRAGLQMECIGCAQCIDACDHVMDKVAKPRGLIRYTSADELAGKPRSIWRPRTFVYPALLALVAVLFVWNLDHRAATEVWVLRPAGPTFFPLDDGQVAAQVRIKLENKTKLTRTYRFALVESELGTLRSPMPAWTLAPGKATEVPLFVDTPRATFVHGQRSIHLRIDDDHGWSKVLPITLIGPEGTP
ncbi:MAG: cytochrome c oxidase accessory protein CcoG [Kofleriaceae bacterium]